jgi:hypothetical protein
MLRNQIAPYLDEDGGGGSGGEGLSAEQEEFLESLGIGTGSDEDDDDDDDGSDDDGDEDEDEPGDDDDEGEGDDGEEDDSDDSSPPPKTPKTKDSKQSEAFARMRIENAQLKRTLDSIAKGLGLPDNLPTEQKTAKIAEVIQTAQSKQTGVPLEIIQRLEALEQENNSFKSKDVELYNTETFATIKTKFGVDDNDIEQFKKDLAENNFDYEHSKQPLESIFMTFYFDSLVERRMKADEAKEEKRKEKAEKHSTSPSDGKGKSNDVGKDNKIDSVSALDDLLAPYEKK